MTALNPETLIRRAAKCVAATSASIFALTGNAVDVGGLPVKGFLQSEYAYTVADPSHPSKFLNRLELSLQGKFSEIVQWKVSGGFAYNAVFDVTDYYPGNVRQDQRREFIARENYLDFSSGDWNLRLGRQHIIWGEVPGIFMADVVSAKDQREFLLTEFELLRIPQWAARGEYFKDDFHAELVWVPVMSYDQIGKPGAEFYPFSPTPLPGFGLVIDNERRPSRTIDNSAYGIRLSYVKDGWDGALFLYNSPDASPVFVREIVTAPTPTIIFHPEHHKIQQFGGTLTKDLGPAVLKFEGVYTAGREFNVTRLTDADGVVRQDTFDYLIGLDFPLENESRLNVQFFQRVYRNHDPDILPEHIESGATFLYSTKFGSSIEPQLLVVHSLNRSEWMARPRVTWTPAPNWRVAFGADYFDGPLTGLFGRFRDKDRVYVEVRRSF